VRRIDIDSRVPGVVSLRLCPPLLAVLDQFSRWQHDYLASLRSNKKVQRYMAPRHAVEDGTARDHRRRVYLPRQVVGSKRYLQGKIADGMAMVQALGKTTYFITFTANPKWPEVTAQLLPNSSGGYQSYNERMDAITRVFRIKLLVRSAVLPGHSCCLTRSPRLHMLQALLDDLRTGRAFGGKAVYIFYVIGEWPCCPEFRLCCVSTTNPPPCVSTMNPPPCRVPEAWASSRSHRLPSRRGAALAPRAHRLGRVGRAPRHLPVPLRPRSSRVSVP